MFSKILWMSVINVKERIGDVETMKKRMVLTMVVAATLTSIIFVGCGAGETGVPISSTNLETLDINIANSPNTSDENEVTKETTDTESVPEESVEQNENRSEDNNAGSAQASSGNTQSTPAQSTPTQNTPTQNTPTQTTKPTEHAQTEHQHAWKEHTATKQEWVPNIVDVPDYETQYVTVGRQTCYCGATFEGEDATAACSQHCEDMLYAFLATDPRTSEDWDSFKCWGYGGAEWQEARKVQVGSHTEDQGYYQTVSYVDYYYCDCGATK